MTPEQKKQIEELLALGEKHPNACSCETVREFLIELGSNAYFAKEALRALLDEVERLRKEKAAWIGLQDGTALVVQSLEAQLKERDALLDWVSIETYKIFRLDHSAPSQIGKTAKLIADKIQKERSK